MSRNEFKTKVSKVCWTLVTFCLCMMYFCMSGCGGGEDSPILPDTPSIGNNSMTISPDTLYLKADGKEKGSFQVKLKKTASFFAKVEKDWCKLDNADGVGSSTYTVSVTSEPNTQTESRTSRISFYSGDCTEYAYVIQQAAEKVKDIIITPDTLYLDGEIGSKGTVTVHLIDNSAYDLGETSHFEREVIEEENGRVLKINYTVIREYKDDLIIRMGVLQNRVQKFYYVCQKLKKKEEENKDKFELTVTPDTLSVDSKAQSAAFTVALDKEVSINPSLNADWCRLVADSYKKTSQHYKLILDFDANWGDERYATVTIKVGSTTVTRVVKQAAFNTQKVTIGGTVAEAVDLGLSVKWASHNLGASSQEGSGAYLAWGELKEKDVYDENTYAHYNNSYATWTDIGSEISGTKYDASTQNWGPDWRMPTKDEVQELLNKCTWKWTQINNVNGFKVTGPNGKYIFIPAAGQKFKNKEIPEYNKQIRLWTGTYFSTNSSNAYALVTNSTNSYALWGYLRDDGYPIRPVSKSAYTGQGNGQAGGGTNIGE